jgi:hypothetical protein
MGTERATSFKHTDNYVTLHNTEISEAPISLSHLTAYVTVYGTLSCISVIVSVHLSIVLVTSV